MDLIDSHAHLEFPQFDEDREEMLARARAAGVNTILAIGSGTGPKRLDAAIGFADRYDWIYATVGIHPHEAKLATEEHYAALDRLARHPKVIAWGHRRHAARRRGRGHARRPRGQGPHGRRAPRAQ